MRSDRDQTQSVTVTLNAQGYQPESFSLRQGIPARITFVRKVESSCGTEIVLADYNIKRELPLNQSVVVEFTPAKIGEFKFACGMDMLRGKIIVR
jgi:plastocyanin domain-containing protein